ncbi:Cycloartenol synthase [Dichanthelium oligosanthes]|uniref:Cycloartenol synthase n=1 Tax=Dichanthelium oligosanthes TaxID=888268 RepID=A0A1E5UPY1_9POAL|nr:Cycloartenol synthase [Dichanthelium oligosanthes]
MLACWIEDPNSEAFKLHIPRIYDYLWLAEDGMKMKGYDGSQLWDAAFTAQAIVGTDLIKKFSPTLKRVHAFVKNSQVLHNCPGDLKHWYRHKSKGGWTFSTADQGWTVSDCTATGLKAALLLSMISPEIVGEPLEAERFYDAIDCLMSFKNKHSGFASYELTRSYAWLELFYLNDHFSFMIIHYVQFVEKSVHCVQQEIIGVFNQNCMISYSQYRNIFPIWALGEYRSHILNPGKE